MRHRLGARAAGALRCGPSWSRGSTPTRPTRGKLKALAGLGVTVAAAVPDRWSPVGPRRRAADGLGRRRRGPDRAHRGARQHLPRCRSRLEPERAAPPAHRLPSRAGPDRGGAMDPGRLDRRRPGPPSASALRGPHPREPSRRPRRARPDPAIARPRPRQGTARRQRAGRQAGDQAAPLARAPGDSPAGSGAAAARRAARAGRAHDRILRAAHPREGTRSPLPRLREAGRPLDHHGGRNRARPGGAGRPRRAARHRGTGHLARRPSPPAGGRGLAPAGLRGRSPPERRRAGSRWRLAPRWRRWRTASPVVASAAGRAARDRRRGRHGRRRGGRRRHRRGAPAPPRRSRGARAARAPRAGGG